MGISIDDCIKELLINKEDDTYVLGNETIDFAIEIMCKYQKIEQILKGTHEGCITKYQKIESVVEDGKID